MGFKKSPGRGVKPETHQQMKIAIIGAGIAGNTLAYHLHKAHDITVFSADSHVGGHTHTHSDDEGRVRTEKKSGLLLR